MLVAKQGNDESELLVGGMAKTKRREKEETWRSTMVAAVVTVMAFEEKRRERKSRMDMGMEAAFRVLNWGDCFD